MDTHLDKENYTKTLLHELHHVFQFCKGELTLKSSKRYYKGECMEDLEYYQQSHEIEAHFSNTPKYVLMRLMKKCWNA